MVKDQRRRFLKLADQLRQNNPALSDEQRNYLADRFEEIAYGANANDIFGLSFWQGRSRLEEHSKHNFVRIFHWIEGAIDADGHALTITQALEAASCLSNNLAWKNPKNPKMILKPGPTGLFKPISFEMLRKAWYDPQNKHLKRQQINESDDVFPYWLEKLGN